ncbi:MAG: hypothetical protein NZ805_10050 [Armatimonadetes bacterium]|nr:hypothetical protein [Armatimonadota bacterium]MDW8028671.1 hypothetical protein [Armatimonadota bacterium]
MRLTTVVITLLLSAAIAFAQCALCKSSVQSSGDPNLIAGLRSGILLLLFMPYLVFGLIAFGIYRAYRKSLSWHPERN